LCLVLGYAGLVRAEPAPAQVWIAPGDPRLGAAVRAALQRTLRTRGRKLREVAIPHAEELSLSGDLDRARNLYHELKFSDALAVLTQLSSSAQRLGGGDLDSGSLVELYLTLGLCAIELAQPDIAWDAFVRSVRIDPSRALDPARFPPRASASHRRAQLELGQLPPVLLELHLPADARARIDGDEGHGAGTLDRRLVPGPHFVRVDGPGYEPYRAMVTFTQTHEMFTPELRPISAPIPDEADVSARLERASEGWRLALRNHTAGLSLEARAPVRAEDAVAVAARLADRVLGVPAKRTPVWKRWWVWTLAGAAVAAVAISVPVALTQRGGTIAGSAGGRLDPIK
jgi:hypothetical protein